MKKKKKQISQREHERRRIQRQSEWLYTPEGPLTATKIKGGYRLSNGWNRAIDEVCRKIPHSDNECAMLMLMKRKPHESLPNAQADRQAESE